MSKIVLTRIRCAHFFHPSVQVSDSLVPAEAIEPYKTGLDPDSLDQLWATSFDPSPNRAPFAGRLSCLLRTTRTSISRGNETSTLESSLPLVEPPRITLLGPKSILSIAVLSIIKQLVRNRRSSEILKFVLSGFIESTLETVYDTNVCNIF